ncbi:GGDEF domain-containing protein [Marinomonas aquiplantarum]|uniref:Diguanylate cyclase (GGDEF)-like protein n=1 Tax=Marinomonas aquiplantarum TaxID=491951 RepID=A0A366D9K2_9GAMM|nr:GGDEF domain-containing protein [Marinomonas aquiplantarum]RBO85938.1 diguanylate cyclase (GGDEF)-like protein [Marinomonas aquiplantarum]
MSIESSKSLLDEQQALRSRVSLLEKERDFIKSLYSDMSQMMQIISKGAPLSSLLNRFREKIKSQLSQSYCLFLVCDKECLQWRLQYSDLVSESLLNSKGMLVDLPQALISFAAAPSCQKRHESDIRNATNWHPWQAFLNTHDFSDVSMVSNSDEQGAIYIMLAFQKRHQQLESDLMETALDAYCSWLDAVFIREKANYQLLEDNHRNPVTGLLRRFSFENSFGIVLKDSRRHFQRAAMFSIQLLSKKKVDDDELRVLAELIREEVRENDLIAHYDERELVMGIRIQNLSDAEVVASKLLESMQQEKYASNSLIESGVSIGIAFYPEHSSLDALYQAAHFAANSLKNMSGYQIEFHGALYDSSSEFYSL